MNYHRLNNFITDSPNVIIISVSFTGLFVLLAVLTIMIIVLIAIKVRKVKHRNLVLSRRMYCDSTSTDTTMRSSGRESPDTNWFNSHTPINLTSFQMRSDAIEDDIALEMNVCYESQHKPSSKKKKVQDTSDTESLHIYDDVIASSGTLSQVGNGLATPFNHVTDKNQEIKSHDVVGGTFVPMRDVPRSRKKSQPPVVNLNNQPARLLSREESGTYVDVTSPPYENVDPVDGSPRPLRGHSFVISDWTEGTHAYAQLESGADVALACLHTEEAQFPAQPYEIPISTQTRKQQRT